MHCCRYAPNVHNYPWCGRLGETEVCLPFTALLIEDNDDEREIFRIALYYNGYTVVEAANGASAITSARAARPDIIITDLKLPDMNGFIAADIIRTHAGYENIPLMCVTGYDITDIADLRCDLLLRKPVVSHALVAATQRLLSSTELKEE